MWYIVSLWGSPLGFHKSTAPKPYEFLHKPNCLLYVLDLGLCRGRGEQALDDIEAG